MVSIIDIGTNTVRLITYEKGKVTIDIALRSEIMRDTSCGNLTDSGIQNLINTIKYLISKTPNIKIYAIATEAVRVLENKEEVKEKIFNETGILIDILSGEEEGECVFSGVINDIDEKKGTIIDLGGGSIEIIRFNDRKIKTIKTLPCGCKTIKTKFSLDIIPENEEIIEKYIKEQINPDETDGKLYMVGGTAKTVLKINNFICKKDKKVIKTEEITKVLEYIKEKNEKEIKEIFKSRYDTIAIGTIIMKNLADIFNKDEIYVKNTGVREGYLIKKEMNI